MRCNMQPAGPMQLLAMPMHAWHTVQIDDVTGIHEAAAGHNTILVCVEKLTTYVHVVACIQASSSFDGVAIFAKLVANHGLPS